MTQAVVSRYQMISFVAICASLSGCVANGGARETASAPTQQPTDSAPSSDAARVALALTHAQTAFEGADVAALERAYASLQRLDAAPQNESDTAQLTQWRARLSDTLPPLRGRALGPAFRSGSLRPGASQRVEQTFYGGKRANVVVRVSSGPGLKLRVIDNAARNVCEDTAHVIECGWMPLYTQRHRIEIHNQGAQVSNYYIVFD